MRLYYVVANGAGFGQIQVFKSQVVGTAYARIYKDGTTPPAFSAMTDNVATWRYDYNSGYVAGLYVYEFKDDNHPSGKQICKMVIRDNTVISCPEDASVNLSPTGLKVITTPASGITVSVDGGTTFKAVDPPSGSVFFYNSELDAAGITTAVPSIIIRKAACGDYTTGQSFIIDATDPLVVTPMVTNVTVNGGSDGGIVLAITGGSGNFTFSWADGPTTQNRSGLVAGTYTVTVHDVTIGNNVVVPITVAEPSLLPKQVGTFLKVPGMNSISYVVEQSVDQCLNPQALDNLLFAEQYFEGIEQNVQNYFQRVCKCDKFPTQFYSDYPFFQIQLKDLCTDIVIKEFSYELKEQNIGATEDFAITINNHTVINQSRVYFSSGVPPIPVKVGDSFTILNNTNFNGTYAVVAIETDASRGYQYLVITKNFVGAANQTATGRFIVSSANFNVFETLHDFTDVADGVFYILIRAYDEDTESPDIFAISEPISIKNEHPETNLIRYRCVDNCFDMTWTTGYLGLLRIPSHFGNKRTPGGERSVSRDADYTLVKINARKSRVVIFTAWNLPPYMHEKLSVVFDCDELAINNLICQTSEAYDPDEGDDYAMFTKGTAKVEVKWFSGYNSDDIGSVQDDGFITTEKGFLKR